jgi:hypothetical protein
MLHWGINAEDIHIAVGSRNYVASIKAQRGMVTYRREALENSVVEQARTAQVNSLSETVSSLRAHLPKLRCF